MFFLFHFIFCAGHFLHIWLCLLFFNNLKKCLNAQCVSHYTHIYYQTCHSALYIWTLGLEKPILMDN